MYSQGNKLKYKLTFNSIKLVHVILRIDCNRGCSKLGRKIHSKFMNTHYRPRPRRHDIMSANKDM